MRYCPSLIRMLVIDGASVKDAAKIVGCPPVTVSNFKSRHGMADFVAKRISMETKNEIVIRAKSGESYYSIGEDLGISHSTVSNIARANGVHRGKGNGCASEANAKRHSEAKRRMSIVLSDRFEVIDLKPRNRATLRCKACGDVFERTVDYKYMTTCFSCERIEAERKAAKRREEAMKRALMQRIVNILAYEHVCPECGARFRSSNSQKLYCSDRCKNRRKGYSDHETRAKKFGVEFDRSITLSRLIQRDGLECYICGKECNTNDKRWGSFGPDYPTIDCVMAMSNGGTFTWDNVRVACGECNCVRKGSRDVAELMVVQQRHPGGMPL